MDITKALEIVEQYKTNWCISGTLETLQQMSNNQRDLSEEEYSAYRLAMNEFRRLFAPV
jgi:hypothetical protein